jgi:hypothetical protein
MFYISSSREPWLTHEPRGEKFAVAYAPNVLPCLKPKE